ncbi:MAG: hypothetical protein Q9224_007471, partial [Gallowayella concinna]
VMNNAIEEWLRESHNDRMVDDDRKDQLRLSFTTLGCMLLLSPGSFEKTGWKRIRHCDNDNDPTELYRCIAEHLKVTHIAINEPIPPLQANEHEENISRAPINFTPLHGDFGPEICSSPPTEEDFTKAFWVTAKQNGIFQTWAPRWTMFSRGNITEKARLITLPSVAQAVEQGKADGRRCAAVDLYAGIGYFAFSYLKAGVSKVLCWDINPWSIEGLRRGATANKWSTAVYNEHEPVDAFGVEDVELLVFLETNA